MKKRPLCLLCFLMMLFLGMSDLTGIPLATGNPLPDNVQRWIQAHPASRICGEVERYENTEFSQSVYLKKTYLIYQSKKFPIYNVRVFLNNEEELKTGMSLFIKGTLKRVEAPTNPGGFNSRQYYACRHIYYFMKKGVILKKTKNYSGYRQTLSDIKEACKKRLELAAGESAPVFEAVVLGDKTSLDPELRMRYQMAGIVHILAISGLHISILGMGLYNLLKRVGLGIWPAGIFSLVIMLQYEMMTGGSVSAMRAVTMFLIAMGARITGRIYDLPSALSITAMLILAESPSYIRDSGFLLSFGCVMGICVAADRVCALAGAKRKLTRAFFSSAAIQLVTLPVMLKFFGEISLAGLVLNLLILPSVGVVLAGGVAAVLLGFVSIPVARVVVAPARALLFLYEKICVWAGSSRWCTWIGGEPKSWQIMIYYGILATVLFMGQYIKQLKQDKKEQKNDRGRKWGLRLAAVLLLSGGFFVISLPAFINLSGNLKIICLDVGQGDGILIQTPENRHYLIDGGSSSQKELGRYCLLPALKNQGISYLDGIFISHTDLDHISGVQELLEYIEKGLTTIHVGYLILPGWNGGKQQPEAWKELAGAAERAGVKVVTANAGDKIHSATISFSILWPEAGAEGKDVNEEAMVMELIYGDFEMLFTGDIGEETEKKLLSEGRLKDVDCLKVGHHGSRYSSSEAFLAAVKPEISVISCSSTNTYGHPSPETIQRLEACGSQVEYTMKNGAITLETDGKKLQLHENNPKREKNK